MNITPQQLLLLFVSLFTLYSPLANIGPYASLVGHFPRADQKKLAFAVFVNAVVVLFGVVIWLTHLFSPPLAARLRPQARAVLTRIGGIVLVAISVQLLAGGLKGLFPVLAG